MNKKILWVFALLLLVASVSALTVITDDGVEAPSFNISNFLFGNSSHFCIGNQCLSSFSSNPYLTNYSYVNGVVLGNATSGYNDTWINITINGVVNGNRTQILTAIQNNYSAFLNTSNLTYDSFTSANNQSIWTAINAISGGDPSFNKSWVQSFFINSTNTTINNGIKFWYNMSDGSYNASYVYLNGTGITLNANQFNISSLVSQWLYNETIPSQAFAMSQYTGNNTLWLSTYNATYDASVANNSWNQSYANGLYSSIIWNYNQTIPALTYFNLNLPLNISAERLVTNSSIDLKITLAGIDASFNKTWVSQNFVNSSNSTLQGLYNNASYLSTFNGSYTLQSDTNANFSAIGTNNSNSFIPYTGASKNIVIGNFNFSINTTTLFVNALTGRVGINTNASTHELNVVGSTNITGSLFLGSPSVLVNSFLYNQTTFALTNASNTYVPYNGANANINLSSFNYTRTNLTIYDNGTCGLIQLGGLLIRGC